MIQALFEAKKDNQNTVIVTKKSEIIVLARFFFIICINLFITKKTNHMS